MLKAPLSLVQIIPLVIVASSSLTVATAANPPLPMTVGKTYSGTLAPSPTNPQGEVCYRLLAQPDTRIVLNVKSDGAGILKVAVYDKAKALKYLYNNVNNPQQNKSTTPVSRFSFPALGDSSQICLTTSNPNRAQQYDLSVSGKLDSPKKSRLALRLPKANRVMVAPPAPKINIPPSLTIDAATPKVAAAPPVPPAPSAPKVDAPPPPTGEPYCFVGTWQIKDLRAYWLQTIQYFTQANVTPTAPVGYIKLNLNKNGTATLEAFDFEQRYSLRVKETGVALDRLGVGLNGNAWARFQSNADNTLTFNSQDYRRLTNKLNIGLNFKLTGDRLFTIFGDRDAPALKLPYTCVNRDNLVIRIPTPTGQKLIPVSFKRLD